MAVALAVVLAGCGVIPMPDVGPTIVEGTFLDANGAPVVGAEVILQVQDWTNAVDPFQAVETVFTTSTTTDPAGRFAFRGAPAAEILAYAGAVGSVNFDLTGIPRGTSDFATWSFERALDGPAWVGDAPSVDLQMAGRPDAADPVSALRPTRRDGVQVRRPGRRRVPGGPGRPDRRRVGRYLFLRDNPKGAWRERWVHTAGCRRWFELERDTLTNEIRP